jgi:hypothetical protein
VTRKTSEEFRPATKVEAVQTSTGCSIANMPKMTTRIMGDFLRHDPEANPASKAWDGRSKRVHDVYVAYDEAVNRLG